MSALYGSLNSDTRKTQATSRGHQRIEGHLRGWTLGVEVRAYYDKKTGKEEFHVYKTGGSQSPSNCELLAVVKHDEN